MPYGELELNLARLVSAGPEEIRSRFRKLRLRPFPDAINSGTGNRLRYDLRRVIALMAAFELNNLSLPQGHATQMVETCWPELCRAVLSAAAQSEFRLDIVNMPDSTGPLWAIGCGAIASKGRLLVDAVAVREFDLEALAFRPAIGIDTRRLLNILIAWANEQGAPMVSALKQQLQDLRRDYGWQPSAVEGAELSDASDLSGTSFLVDGPFYARALEFLQAEPIEQGSTNRPAVRYRLQWLYNYLEDPAPIDVAKREIGLRDSQMSLRHYVYYHARDLGLAVHEEYPLTWNDDDDVRSSGLGLLAGLQS